LEHCITTKTAFEVTHLEQYKFYHLPSSDEARLQSRPTPAMQDSHQSPTAYKVLLKPAMIATLALGLLWYAFKGINFSDIWNYTKNLKPLPVLMIFISGVFGNFLRSYRWTLLLSPLKSASEAKISQFNTFYSVSIGYAVNVFAPRGGEVARLLSICKSEKLPWAGVLPTVLIDRLLDVAILLAIFGVTLLILPPDLLHAMPWLQTGGSVLLLIVSIGLALLPRAGTIFSKMLNSTVLQKLLSKNLRTKFCQLTADFDQGTQSLKNITVYPKVALISIGIWFTYWLNFYLMSQAFGLDDIIDAAKCLIIFSIGSIGSLIPTPSSVGGFHLLVKEAAVITVKLDPTQAIAYATVLHFVSMIVVSLIPALALWLYKRYSYK